MFDLISGRPRHPFHKPTAVPVVVSIVGHAAAMSLVVVLPLLHAADAIPNVPSMMAFVAAEPAPPPPPPPPPPARPAPARAVPSRPQPVTSGEFAAPVEAPADVRPEPPGEINDAGEDGVEGGIQGGIAGGIVGGLVAAPPPPPPPPPAPPKGPVRIGGAVLAPALIKHVEPVYPDVALMAKVGGMVILEAVFNADGTVESVHILRSVKFLDQAALDAVKQWRYSPLMLNGIPTPFILTVTLTFRTEGK